jgi:hypothetical protein
MQVNLGLTGVQTSRQDFMLAAMGKPAFTYHGAVAFFGVACD